MSKCGLCGKELGKGKGFGSYGILPPSVKVCSDCFEDLKTLYNGAPKMSENDYQAECKRFREKYANASAETVLTEATGLRNGTSSSGSGSEELYSNAGGTMITLAKVIFAVFSIISVISGLVVGSASYDFNFMLFLLISVVGVLVAYLAGLGFAAFGHLVCDVKYIKDELSKKK